MKLWTDYPVKDTDSRIHPPVRKVSLVGYDGNKYATVKYRGVEYSIKTGYLYTRPYRWTWGGRNIRRQLKSVSRGVCDALFKRTHRPTTPELSDRRTAK